MYKNLFRDNHFRMKKFAMYNEWLFGYRNIHIKSRVKFEYYAEFLAKTGWSYFYVVMFVFSLNHM